MLSVMWSLIPLIAAANKVIKVTHLLAVTEFRMQSWKPAIHATHPPAVCLTKLLIYQFCNKTNNFRRKC